jgi:pantoate--beta-alanine ligase
MLQRSKTRPPKPAASRAKSQAKARGMSKNRTKGAKKIAVVRRVSALRAMTAGLRKGGKTLALVPTMGALHDGHIALVRLARKKADRVAVSIFVNPTQFAPTEDLASYPRTFDSDLKKLKAEGVDLVWAPDAATMYPDGFATRIAPEGPAKVGLEDKYRPQFFGGVATVVAKLFAQVRPDFAMFGEKDYQQLKVVTRMAADLDLAVKVIGVPTLREKDGLALSSRNVYLAPAERANAVVLSQTLRDCAKALRAGAPLAPTLDDGRRRIEAAGFTLDYLEARNAETLAEVTSRDGGPLRLLVAAKIGRTRLIDNMAV